MRPENLRSLDLNLLAVADALLRMFDAAVMSRDVPLATRIVAGVRHLDDGSSRFARWLEEAISETRLRPVAGAALEGGQDPGVAYRDLFNLFKASGPLAVPIMLSLLPSFGDPAMRRALSDLALELASGARSQAQPGGEGWDGSAGPGPHGVEHVEYLLDLLNNEQLFVVQEALYILHRLDTPAAQALEQRAEQNVRAEVRVAALAAAAEHNPEVAVRRAERMLEDPEPRAKVAAAQVLGRLGDVQAARFVESYVERPDLDELPAEVKKELFRAYALLCGVRSLHLLARYIKRGEGLLSKKEAEDQALLAMDAVAMVRVPRAVELLKRAAVSRNKRVRDAARARLLRMKEKA
ncbi:MAG: hypothetical protein KC933_00200 [Myxococcales bacterium]|nr:hypothetical protein [Myxococcales bacterium]